MRIILRIFFVVIGVVVGVIAAFPTIVSTPWGKSVFFDAVARYSGYHLKADLLYLSWFDVQHITKLEIVDKKETTILRCEEISSDAPLWEILGRKEVGKLTVRAPKMTLEATFGPAPSIAFLEAGFVPGIRYRPELSFTGNLLIQNGEISFLSSGIDPISFQSIEADISIPKKEPWHAILSGTTAQGSVAGSFDISAILDDSLEAKGKLVHLPVLGIDQIVSLFEPKLKGRVFEMLGDTLDLDFDLSSKGEVFAADFNATSPQFSANFKTMGNPDGSVILAAPGVADLKVAGKEVHFQINSFSMPPAHLEAFGFDSVITISPQNYTVHLSSRNFEERKFQVSFEAPEVHLNPIEVLWEKPLSFTVTSQDLNGHIAFNEKGSLENPAHFSFILPQFDTALPFVLTEPVNLEVTVLKLELARLYFQAEAKIKRLAFMEKESKAVTTLQDIEVSIEKDKTIAFDSVGAALPTGKFEAKGTFDPDKRSTKLDLTFAQFPTSLFDLVTHLPVSQILGTAVNTKVHAEIQEGNGPVSMDLKSSTTIASLKGFVKNGFLNLSDTAHAQITPATLSLTFKNPITISVPPDGFSIPLYPFSLDKINIPNMRVELGKFSAQNVGNLNITTHLLKLTQFNKEKGLELWFAPMDLHVKDGVVECERTEVLIEKAFDVCYWGNISLPQDKVDMVLGLTASCLKKAFGIKDLPEKYVLQLPVTGTLTDIEINTDKATAKVAALMLWQQKAIAGALSKSPVGALVGELINKLGPLPDEGVSAPPPKHPFPWEGVEPQKTSNVEEAPKKKKHFRKDDKPLQQLLKMLK